MLKIGKIKQEPYTMIVGQAYDSTYVISETFDLEKYNDATSNSLWLEIGRMNYDYKFIRSQIMYRTAIKGFANLKLDEQICAASVFGVGKPERDSVLTNEEQLKCWTIFMAESLECRQKRLADAKSYISYYLPTLDSIDLAKSTDALSFNYLTYGIESLADDGVDGLFDWLENTGSYSLNGGYNSKSYYSEVHKNNIMNYLRNGFILP